MSNRLLLCCALLCATALIARADDNKPITNSGAANLSFTFGGLNTLAAGPIFSGSPAAVPVYSVGYRTFIANEMALRASLGLLIGSTTTPSSNTSVTDDKVSRTGLQIGVGIVKFMQATAALSGFMGGQVSYLMGTNKHTPPHATGGTDDFNSSSGNSLGINVMIGGEWFFNQAMSLGAEYQFGFASSSGSSTNSTNGTETTADGESSTFIGTGAASLSLNVYLSR